MNHIINDKDNKVLSRLIMRTFEKKSSSPHVLVELSTKEHKRHQYNTIHLQGLSLCESSKTLIWSKVTYGSNIKLKKKSTCSTSDLKYDELCLNRTKYSRVIVTASKEECSKHLPSLITSCSTHNIEPSGVVVLMMTTWKPVSKTNKKWNEDDFNRIKKCKPNILKSSNHHKSAGFYASFGNKGSFDRIPDVNSSVGQYVSKKNQSLPKQLLINQEATYYEKYTANEISRSVHDFQLFIPNIKTIIAPVLDTSFEMQSLVKDINLKEGYASKDGCWQTSLCVNATTEEFHNEDDCTYTLITIPRQINIEDNKTCNRYHFLFNLTGKKNLNLPLYPGVSFLFSGAFLTHRQHCNDDVSSKNDVFFNIASYGNKRLFNHIKKTYNKNK